MSGADGRPRVALGVDRPGGPGELRARALAVRLARRFAFRIAQHARELEPGALDLLYVFPGADPSFAGLELPPQRRVLELAHADASLAGAACLTTTSRALFAGLQGRHARVFHVPQGVDTRRFQAQRRAGSRLRVGWLGAWP